MNFQDIQTLGQLRAAGYTYQSIGDEIRKNMISALQNKETTFPGIMGFDETVIPDMERAILSRHSILLLGLRGQAKTRIARLMTRFLDEYVPVVQGSEINDDPLAPLSYKAKQLIAEHGEDTPVAWIHRDERYVEKLATPDVSIADLIGDIDPIKAANLKLDYSDERVLHFGLIPRAHRCIFVLNELPDLQPRIQVSLFNILQEGDIQIRGFKIRLPLDLQFVFTANPEDYTNRGSIITPLKDRIESQIMTHYPEDIVDLREITRQEAQLSDFQRENIAIPLVMRDIIELISLEARAHDMIDANSGVSMRLSISVLENLYSAAERRMLLNGETKGHTRISDLWGIIPSIVGKIELLYEGEQVGVRRIALDLIAEAVSVVFATRFGEPSEMDESEVDPYQILDEYFRAGNVCELPVDASEEVYRHILSSVPSLEGICQGPYDADYELYIWMETVLHGLAREGLMSIDFVGDMFIISNGYEDLMGLQ